MSRPPDDAKRASMLSDVIDYIAVYGLADLSLRPLASALGTSSRMLIHYFGTKERMLIAALNTQRPDMTALFADASDTDALRRRLEELWTASTVGADQPSVNVVLQVLGAASVEPSPFREYAADAVHAFVLPLADAVRRTNPAVDDAEAVSSILVAGLRGLLQDRLVTKDFDRVDRAARRLIDQSLSAATCHR